jgi:hypothetical protein
MAAAAAALLTNVKQNNALSQFMLIAKESLLFLYVVVRCVIVTHNDSSA